MKNAHKKNTNKYAGYSYPHQGSAIVVALFVVALVTMAAVALLTRFQQDMRRTELILNDTQANFYAQGSIAWAEDQLINDWKFQQPNQIIDKTPIQSPINKMDNASIQSIIYDAQGYFNLNNLVDVKNQGSFLLLVKAITKMKEGDILTLSLATYDWVAGGKSSYDEMYMKQNPPYRSPHHAMTSASELRLIQGMTADLYQRLSPYIIALPITTPVNINNAPAPVLMSLSPTLTLDSAKTIEARAKQSPFPTVAAFLALDVVKNNNVPADKITVSSSFFLVKTIVTIGDQTTILYTLMQRDIKNSQPIITILWQSKGSL